MAEREIVGVYTALRDQALGFGAAEIKAPRRGRAPESELAGGGHPLSPLYVAGQDLVTEIRLVDEPRQADT